MATPPSWDTAYAPGAAPPPWDTGRPQPTFLRLADHGLLSGRLLDAGCGTGEHALLAAARGAQATGIEADTFEVNPGMPTPVVQAWLAAIRRT